MSYGMIPCCLILFIKRERRGQNGPTSSKTRRGCGSQVAQGIIWVWGDNGPDAVLESAVTPAPLIPELNDAETVESGRVAASSLYQRDLPYSWEIFMENVVVSQGRTREPKKIDALFFLESLGRGDGIPLIESSGENLLKQTCFTNIKHKRQEKIS